MTITVSIISITLHPKVLHSFKSITLLIKIITFSLINVTFSRINIIFSNKIKVL